jgi:hypothetical protein
VTKKPIEKLVLDIETLSELCPEKARKVNGGNWVYVSELCWRGDDGKNDSPTLKNANHMLGFIV